MKQIVRLLILSLALVMTATSCWQDEVVGAGAARHQIEGLLATPGDEEALLSWTMPAGWNPTDFIISYSDAEGETVALRTGGQMTFTVTNLQNNYQYEIGVQAVYGDIISQAVSVAVTPSSSRLAVADLAAESGDSYVLLTWSKPSMLLESYTLQYYAEEAPANATSITLNKDTTSYLVEGLENDVTYIFNLTANYAKGASDVATVKALPALAQPYFVDKTSVAIGQPVHFTFNREGLPTATDVKWTFPDGTVLTGDEVDGSFASVNDDARVTLSATIASQAKSWQISIKVREYVVLSTAWEQDGTAYNGFKGTCPVFSPDGKVVYIITFNKIAALYAFDIETGNELWRYKPESNAGSYNPLTVNPVNGDIYYGTTASGQFYCITSGGQLRWQYKQTGSMQAAAPAVSADGQTVFVGDKNGRVAALDALSGAERWNAQLSKACCGILVNGSEILVGTAAAVNFMNAETGETIKELAFSSTSKGMTDISGFAVAADKNTVYVPQLAGYISSLNLTTREWIVKDLQVAGNNLYEPVVAPNGTVFAGSKDSKAYIIKGDLSGVVLAAQTPTYASAATNAFNYAHPVVTADNVFYISSGQVQNYTIAVNESGVIDSWSEGSSANQKQMGGNNFINGVLFSAYIGASGDNGMFVGRYVGGERAAGWSSHGGDICGSCCIK